MTEHTTISPIITAGTDLGGVAEMLAAPPAGVVKTTLSDYGRLWVANRESEYAGSSGLAEPLNAYQQSLWVYRCVSVIARCAAGIPLVLSARDAAAGDDRRARTRPMRGCKAVRQGKAAAGEIIAAGPAYDLLARPNNYQAFPGLMTAIVSWLYLRGSAAIILADLTGDRPAAVHAVDGRLVTPQWLMDSTGMRTLLGYILRHPRTGAEIPLAVDEVYYWCLWSGSDDPLEGMSPLRPGRLAVASEYAASMFNASSLTNGGEPGVVITVPGTLTDEQRQQAKLEWDSRFRGPGKARRPLFLEGGGDVKPFAVTSRDMEFEAGKKTTRLEICCLFGVPPVVAGWVDAAGDSSAYTSNALRQFYDMTIFPLLDMFAPAFADLARRFDGRLDAWFDVEDQPVVQEMRLARLDSAVKLFGMGYPPNAINDALDLGMVETEWGDTGYLPGGLLPAGDVAAGNVFPPVPEGPQEEAAGSRQQAAGPGPASSAMKLAAERIWKRWAASWSGQARACRNMLRQHYLAQERQLVAALRAAEPGTRNPEPGTPPGTEPLGQGQRGDAGGPGSELRAPGSAKLDEAVIGRIIARVFADRRAADKFRSRLRTFVEDANRLGIRQALAEAGLSGERLDEAVRLLLSNPAIQRAIANQVLRDSALIDARTRTILRRQLMEGSQAGESIGQLTDRIHDVMQGRRTDAANIARNSMGYAISSARHEGFISGGMTHKAWLHSRGPGERRPSHIEAESRYAADPIPIGEPFRIGNARLMYPRDFASGSPEETINCQCLQVAIRRPAGSRAPTTAEVLAEYETRTFIAEDAEKRQ